MPNSVSNGISRVVSQYLEIYAEPESKELELFDKSYDYVIVVPICNEPVACLKTIFSNNKANVLIVIVINSSPERLDWQVNNSLFVKQICANSILSTPLSSQSQLLEFNSFNDILLIDKNTQSQQIKDSQGVGMARKIGCDVALKYFTFGNIKNPWIFSTDADVILPENYFSDSIKNRTEYSAIVLDFEHYSNDSNLNNLQFYYDFKLRYYHAAIVNAGTNYDYIPLGSTIIVNMECYAQVRGFPKRNAGEDFYLLNKLAKIKPIKYLVNGLVVKIKSRFSDRVPFGTGPALLQISQLPTIADYKFYHPQCFLLLKNWIFFLQSLWQQDGLKIQQPTDKVLSELYNHLDCKKIFSRSLPQITSQVRWQQFMHQWFDAFKVLKSVHFFDKKYPRLNYLELLKTTYFDKVVGSQLQIFIKNNDKT